MKKLVLLTCLMLSLFTVNAQEFTFSESFKKKAAADLCDFLDKAKGASFEESLEEAAMAFSKELYGSEKYEEDFKAIMDGRELKDVSAAGLGEAMILAINEDLILTCDKYYHYLRDIRIGSYSEIVTEFSKKSYLEDLAMLQEEAADNISNEQQAYIGMIYFANGNYEQAATFFKKSLEGDGYPESLDFLALVYEQMGVFDKALQLYENVTETQQTETIRAIIQRNQKEPKSALLKIEDLSSKSYNEYFELWQNFETKLTNKVKSSQPYEDFEAEKDGIKLVTYPSDKLELKALLNTTNIEEGKKKPAVVYLHGGWALGYSDVTDCQAFTDAGYIVLAPSYRGENGNDGNFEFFLGEVDDAKAAIKWLQSQPYVDAENISVFGHSAGGALALALSLHPDITINKCGGVAGVYDGESFAYWQEEEGIDVFDVKNEDEVYMRLPVAFLQYMERNHYLYIGTDDDFEDYKTWIEELYEDDFPSKLKMIEVKGDHFSSLKPAMELFLKELEK